MNDRKSLIIVVQSCMEIVNIKKCIPILHDLMECLLFRLLTEYNLLLSTLPVFRDGKAFEIKVSLRLTVHLLKVNSCYRSDNLTMPDAFSDTGGKCSHQTSCLAELKA